VPTSAISSIVVGKAPRRKASLLVRTPHDTVEFVVERVVAREAQRVLAQLFAPGYGCRSPRENFSLKVPAPESDLFSV
jgi:hypothetical protein